MFKLNKALRNYIEANSDLPQALLALSLTKQDSSLYDLVLALIAKRFCELNGIQISQSEIDENVQEIRKDLRLITADDTINWLSNTGISDEQLRLWSEHEAMTEHFRHAIAGDDDVERYYSMNKLKFDEVELYKIVSPTLAASQELRAQVVEGASFFDLAHRYSTDSKTRAVCGYIGRVRREQLEAELESQVFAKNPVQIIGPLKVVSRYHLYRVEAVFRTDLTDKIRTEIQDQLVRDWIANSFEEWLNLDSKRCPIDRR